MRDIPLRSLQRRCALFLKLSQWWEGDRRQLLHSSAVANGRSIVHTKFSACLSIHMAVRLPSSLSTPLLDFFFVFNVTERKGSLHSLCRRGTCRLGRPQPPASQVAQGLCALRYVALQKNECLSPMTVCCCFKLLELRRAAFAADL